MSRLVIPSRDDVPEASRPILDAVHKQLGVVPNMFRLIAQSPAALEAFAANNRRWQRRWTSRRASGSPWLSRR